MTWGEFVARLLGGCAIGGIIWAIAEVIDHPVTWWLALIIGLTIAFLARWIDDIIEALLS